MRSEMTERTVASMVSTPSLRVICVEADLLPCATTTDST